MDAWQGHLVSIFQIALDLSLELMMKSLIVKSELEKDTELFILKNSVVQRKAKNDQMYRDQESIQTWDYSIESILADPQSLRRESKEVLRHFRVNGSCLDWYHSM